MAKIPISATIDKDTNETVKKLAISDRRSNSEMINILLDEAIEARKKVKSKK